MICVRRVVSVCERVGLRGSRHDARERRESRGDGSMGGRPRTREDGESVRYKVAAAPRERRSRQARGGSASARRRGPASARVCVIRYYQKMFSSRRTPRFQLERTLLFSGALGLAARGASPSAGHAALAVVPTATARPSAHTDTRTAAISKHHSLQHITATKLTLSLSRASVPALSRQAGGTDAGRCG